MRSVTIATLTKYPEVFAQCRESLDKFAPGFRRIAIIDASEPVRGTHDLRGWEAVRTEMPYGMGRNSGLAQYVSWPDDLFYICDDVQLMAPGAVEELQRIAYLDSDIGALSPRIQGNCGNHLQSARGKEIRGDFAIADRDLVSICLFWKRSAMIETGLVDPRFTGYGGDDIDYSQRMRGCGWKIAVTPRVTVKHGFGKYDGTVTFQMRGINAAEAIAEMQLKAEEKAWEENCEV